MTNSFKYKTVENTVFCTDSVFTGPSKLFKFTQIFVDSAFLVSSVGRQSDRFFFNDNFFF
jgi:hypothetical protein